MRGAKSTCVMSNPYSSLYRMIRDVPAGNTVRGKQLSPAYLLLKKLSAIPQVQQCASSWTPPTGSSATGALSHAESNSLHRPEGKPERRGVTASGQGDSSGSKHRSPFLVSRRAIASLQHLNPKH